MVPTALLYRKQYSCCRKTNFTKRNRGKNVHDYNMAGAVPSAPIRPRTKCMWCVNSTRCSRCNSSSRGCYRARIDSTSQVCQAIIALGRYVCLRITKMTPSLIPLWLAPALGPWWCECANALRLGDQKGSVRDVPRPSRSDPVLGVAKLRR